MIVNCCDGCERSVVRVKVGEIGVERRMQRCIGSIPEVPDNAVNCGTISIGGLLKYYDRITVSTAGVGDVYNRQRMHGDLLKHAVGAIIRIIGLQLNDICSGR